MKTKNINKWSFLFQYLHYLVLFFHAPGAGELLVPCRNSIQWSTIEFGTCLLSLYYYFVSTDAAGEVHQNKDMFHCMREGMMKGPSMWIFGGNGLDIYSADGSDHLKWLPQHHWVSSKVCFHLSMMRVYSRLMQYLIESYTSYIYTQVPWRWLVFILQLLQCCIRWKEVCLGCRFSRCSKDWCVRHRYGYHSWFLNDL